MPDRILTTHVGSLVRPPRVMSYIEAKAKGHKPKLETIRAPRETKSLLDALTASLKSTSKLKEKAVA